MFLKIRCHTIGVDLKLSICPQQPLFCDLEWLGGGGAETSTMSNVTLDYFVKISEDVFDDS